MISRRKTVIFWGAGATAALGMPLTERQAEFLYKLAVPSTPKKEEPDLCSRVREALKVERDDSTPERWIRAFHDLLIILGDDLSTVGHNDTHDAPSIGHVTPTAIAAMRANLDAGASTDEIHERIIALRTLYDWPALRAVIDVCPRTERDNGGIRIELQDLFNILDMHGQSGHGFQERSGRFLTPQRVFGARSALQMLIQAQFYMSWHRRGRTHENLRHYYDFSVALGRRMQQRGFVLAADGSTECDSRDFYLSNLSFVSLNWDPIALWLQFVANRDLNNSPSVPHVGNPARKLMIFHDLGHFVAGLRVEKHDKRHTPWHPMNESSAQRLNDDDHGAADRIRIGKFLFPHGCLWWRECPSCGKLSSYMGDAWETDSPTLFPPPPLRAFVEGVVTFEPSGAEEEACAWDRGEVDARACVHCKTLTYMHHTPMQIQSNFKSAPPPFMEEVQRDMRVVVEKVDHIIFMGYSLPADDVAYRAFFAARASRKSGTHPKCSIVLGRDQPPRWLGGSELDEHLKTMDKSGPPGATLEAARGLFGRGNVRFYGGGIPQVFLGGGSTVVESAVDQLLDWDEAG